MTTRTAQSHLRPWPAWVLAVVEAFIAYQAVSGGVALIDDRWGMPREWLQRTPFDTWIGPGWVLITLIGIPQALAALVVVVDARPAVLAGFLAGASLLVWIVIQLALLQVFFFLQPVIAVAGLIEIGLAWLWRRRIDAPPDGMSRR
ncbi:hypothetical protein ACWDPV_13805 [Gordonia sp. NPDC003504]